ncbi:MAG: sigma-70 family RNA polymerase sigma factor [Schleiferiaceae bacterium]|nr:sigma-70 family RNA polymerase sigma factor [Schleiferiaceae bacterium]
MMKVTESLIERCRKEDRQAQFELFKLCYGFLMGVCSRYERNKDDAEALLNLAFYKILTKLDHYKADKVPFEAWCRRVTINTIIDEFRKKQKDKHDFVENWDTAIPLNTMDYNEADQKFDAEDLENMIRNLPPLTQKVFNMYIVDGYSHKEISEQLKMSEGTSKWHLSTARSTIKKMLLKVMNHVASIML